MKVLYKTASLLLLACLLLTLSACGSSNTPSDAESPDPAPEETQEETLETLCGEDYVTYIVDTITMQMENRMEKDPEVRYFPIEDNTPLSDYVTIGGTTKFEVDEEGNPVIYFPAGTVTDEANGEQSFRLPKLYQ